MPDYPGAAGRTGYAVGLDVPSSVLAMLHDLKDEGYAVEGIPQSPRELLDLIEDGGEGLSLEEYLALSSELPDEAKAAVEAAWGNVSNLSSFTPPSGLPAISPARGEIGASTASHISEVAGEGR